MKKGIALVLACLLFVAGVSAQTTATYATNGDYIFTPPPGITVLEIYMYGAGGGGNPFLGNGGGSGGFTFGSFALQPNKLCYIHVGKGGTSAQDGESTIIYYLDGLGNKVPYAIAYGGSGVTGAGGLAYNGSFYTRRGGNGSALSNGYYGAGGGMSYINVGDAPTATGTSCNVGGASDVGGVGGNGGGNGCTKTGGTAPGGGGGSGPGVGANGADGRIDINWICPTASDIGTSHTIVFPQERNPDYLADAIGSNPSPTGNGLVYVWQDSSTAHNWQTAPASVNDTKFAIPSIDTVTWYRRKSNICNITQYSNTVKIQVVRKDVIWANKLGTLGSITGAIISKGGNPVKGDSVLCRKRLDLKGSPKEFTYYAVTDNQGNFVLDSMFYGLTSNGDGDPVQVSYYVKPIKYGHVFDITDSLYYDVKLSESAYDKIIKKSAVEAQAFKDLTAISILGKAYQPCDSCLAADQVTVVDTVRRYLDSISIKVNGNQTAPQPTKTGVGNDGSHGNYAVSIDDITINYTITPDTTGSYRRTKREFDTTASTIVQPDADVLGINFSDTNTYAVTGKFRAGCGEIIGQGVLLFTDIPQSPDRDPTFYRRVRTQSNGNYTVRLPAGKYKVKMEDFFPNAGVTGLQRTNVINFFSGDSISTSISPDSLKVSIDTADATLNLNYQRPPEIVLIGMGDTTCISTQGNRFATWKLNDVKPLQIKVYQGPVSKNCALSYDSVRIYTTIQKDGVEEKLVVKVDTSKANLGIAFDTLKAGPPNIAADYTKPIRITYMDKYGNVAGVNSRVVVTGTRGRPGQTFTTVSPQIPMMVLHDPPGDGSSATWSSTKSSEKAMRLYNKTELGGTVWAEAKLGIAFSTEVGFIASVSTDFAAWASINASLSGTARNSTENELIVRTENQTTVTTSALSSGIGADEDIFYVGAMNIVYGISDELFVNSCVVTTKENPIFAPNAINTTATMTRRAVKTDIAKLEQFAAQNTNPDSVRYFKNQARIWQQMLDNDDRNKTNAPFVENRTFVGGGSATTLTSSFSATNTNAIEFGLEVDASLAIELGLEVAGSGIKGGVVINTKMETGTSITNTATSNTQMGYTLIDDDVDDKFTVDIKKDPVYGSPIFNTIAGLSSCPAEDKTILRDEMALTVDVSEVNNQPLGLGYTFNFTCANTSVDPGPKSYVLLLDDNLDGAIINNGSTSYSQAVTNIPKNGTKQVAVTISRPISSNASYSFKNLKFILADNCSGTNVTNLDPKTNRTQLVSLSYASPCSGINLSAPEDGWISKIVNNGILQITFDGYTPANLSSVVLQYRLSGSSSWQEATSTKKTAANLAGSTSYIIDWNFAGLSIPDGKYDVRIKLVCSSGLIYSKSATGIIDRKAPSLFGKPDPTDENYVAGDVIAYNYDQDIDISNLNNGKVEVYRMSNNTRIPVTVSGNGSRIVITPSVNLIAYLGDSIKVVVNNIADLNGNTNTNANISTFTIGTVPIVAGTNIVKVYMVTPSLAEDASGKMEVHFKLKPGALNKAKVTKVNFTIGGTGTFKSDFDTTFNVVKTPVADTAGVIQQIPLYSSYNGSSGYIFIDSTLKEAVLKLDPIGDSVYEPNETIIINLGAGGDYILTDSLTATATILTDELQPPAITANGPLDFCNGGSVILTANTPNVVPRYASSVVAVSNQYSPTLWGASQALGAPNVYPQYGDIQYAWSPTNPDNAREYIVLGYTNPAPVNFVDIYETYNPGAIDTVYVKNDATGAYVQVFAGPAGPAGDSSQIKHITFPKTAFNVSGVRLAMHSSAVPGFNEIDAVGIGLDTTYISYLWNTGANSKSITVNNSGTYSVSVQNAVGQKAKTDPVKVRISHVISNYLTANSFCANPATGALQINATGGIVPYYYKFDSVSADKFQVSKILKPLKAGTYRVNIKDSIECITTTANIIITSPKAITGTFTKTDATCIGKADGTITVTISGGKAPYGYKAGLGGNFNDGNFITGLKAGIYTIYVKDANGCIGTVGPVTVGQANVNCLSFAAAAGVADALKESSLILLLTPNPTIRQFELRAFTESKELVQLNVIDVNGRILYTAKGMAEQPFRFGEVFAPGTYLVVVRQGAVMKTLKAVKMR